MPKSRLAKEWIWVLASTLGAAWAGFGLDALSRAPGLAEPGMVAAHLGSTIAGFFVSYCLLWLPLRWAIGRAGGSTEAGASALGSGLAAFFIAARIVHAPVSPAQFADLGTAGTRLTSVLAALSAATSVLVYMLWIRREREGLHRYATGAVALGAACVWLLWTWRYGGGATGYVGAAVTLAAAFASLRLAPNRAAILLTCAALGLVSAAAFVVADRDRTTKPESLIGGAQLDKPNVILITFDTLRADTVQGPAAGRPATPSFDRFASESIVFDHALSAGGWTAPGAVSLLTGVCPDVHGFGNEIMNLPALSRSTPTLAERLRTAGYRTSAIGVNPVIGTIGLQQRFSERRWRPVKPFGNSLGPQLLREFFARFAHEVGPAVLTTDALAWLQSAGPDPFFLWLHYYDPHQIYAPPRQYVDESLYAPSIGWQTEPMLTSKLRVGSAIRLDSDERRWLRELYDGEVRWSDDSLGRVLDRLKELGLYDTSWVIVSSDHGEEFFEHDGIEHGQSLYDELLHVPFMLKPPGALQPRRVATTVSTASLTPTLIDALSLKHAVPLSSPSIWSSIAQPTEPEAAPIFAGGVRFHENWHAVVFDGHKYIRRNTTGIEELYDLQTDPGEQTPLDKPELLKRGRDLLAKHLQQAAELRKHHTGPQARQMDEGSRDLLRSLGYIQ